MSLRLLCIAAVLCAALLTDSAQAYRPFFGRRAAGLFNQCCTPAPPVGCFPAAPCDPCAPANPLLVPQQGIGCQSVPQVQIQRQAYIEHVPVTTYQLVPRTVMQPQLKYRDVAVQVNSPVAQVPTQFAPRPVGIACSPCGAFGGAISPIYGGISATAGPVAPIPEGGASRPVPTPYMQGASAGEEWRTIRQRGAAAPVPSGAQATPSAATVWQSQLNTGAVAR